MKKEMYVSYSLSIIHVYDVEFLKVNLELPLFEFDRMMLLHLSTFKYDIKHQLLFSTFRCLHQRHPQQVQTVRKTRKVKMALLLVGMKAKKMVSPNRPIHTLVSLLCL